MESLPIFSGANMSNITGSKHLDGGHVDTACDLPVNVFTAVDLFLNGVIMTVLCTLGTIGSGAILLTYSRYGFRDSSTVALSGLALSDLFFSLFQSALQVLHVYETINLGVTVYSSYSIFPWNQFSLTISMLIVATLAFFNIAAVMKGKRLSKMMKPFRMFLMVVGVFGAMVLFLLPLQVLAALDILPLNIRSSARDICKNSDLINRIYMQVSLLVGLSYLPVLVMITCSVMIVVKLVLKKRRNTTCYDDVEENQEILNFKILLILCLTTTILVVSPAMVFEVMYPYLIHRFSCRLIRLCITILQISFQANASNRFLIYVSLNPKFKSVFDNRFRRFRNNHDGALIH
ncbi:FMRFamide receptor-like [Physella acuta]|uniref:FMRFamide receptor-like n=1 Tax=Physella acuta TaxID=109671 RepID=UPI0027DCB16C|nr:FMRFamide receptor-like [Physella acuta]